MEEINLAFVMFSIVSTAILLNTSLVIGFSLVDIHIKEIIWKIIIASVTVSVLFEGVAIFYHHDIYLIIRYIILIPISMWYFRVSFTQTMIALLLGMTFDLAIVHLLEQNLFEILITNRMGEDDLVIHVLYTLFIMMNNVFITIIMYQKRPSLFPSKWFRMFQLQEEQTKMYRLYTFFVVLILGALNSFFYKTFLELPYFRTSFRVFIIFWTILLCVLLVYLLRHALNYQLERSQFFLDKQYQTDLQSFYKVIRSQRHDFNLHLNAIYGMIVSGKYEDSREYIDEVVEEAQHINDLLPIKHPATGAMLNTLSEIATQENIQMEFDIFDDLKEIPCSVYEINKIIGNLVQNAIDAAGNQLSKDERFVHVYIGREYEQIVIRVSNYSTMDLSKIHEMFDIGYSTKEGHEGIGIPSIESILSNYNGVILPEKENNTLYMYVRIPLTQDNQ